MRIQTQITVLASVGGSLTVVLAVLMGCFPTIFNSILNGVLVLSKDSKTIDTFISPPVPILMKFYMFDVTNPIDIIYYGAKPKLNEIGPYVYEEVREKFNMEYSSDGNEISYQQNRTYFFREDLSNNLKESDLITVPNMIMVLLAAVTQGFGKITWIWPEIERTMNVFDTFTVGEVIFQGWDLPEFNLRFNDSGFDILADYGFNGTIAEILEQLGVESENIPDILWENKISYFSTKNHTFDKNYTVSTGNSDISEYMYVRTWGGNTELTAWGDYPYCNMINGTDGTQFPPHIKKDDTIRMFVSELCRSMYLEYSKEVDHYGVKAYHFVTPIEVLQDADTNPDNDCFCSGGVCLGSGFINLTTCLKIPIVMSPPHFYDGDVEMLAKFDGLNPNQADHETYLDLEPNTGVPMIAHKRLQLNVPIKRYESLTSFMNVQDFIFPVFYVDEHAEFAEDDASALKKILYVPFTIMYTVGGILIAVGVVLMVIAGMKHKTLKATQKKERNAVASTSQELQENQSHNL